MSIPNSIIKAATKKAVQATRQVLDGLEPEERLAVVGLGMIALSLIPKEKKGKNQKGKKP
jgi:hypothetical protein